jgi:glycerol-3-phosphate acyltransferase PlsY
MPLWLIPVIAYLLGSIPFGLLLVRLFGGGDVRHEGSGNIGATNVTRVAGAVPGLLTLLLDAGKGILAVWLASKWSGGNIRWISAAAVAAVIGHMFSVWIGFRGGKGVATGLGVILLICPKAIVTAAVLWFVVLIFWRYISLASVSAAAAMPIFIYLLYAPGHAPPTVLSLGIIVISLLVIWKHRANLQRLASGEETPLKFQR